MTKTNRFSVFSGFTFIVALCVQSFPLPLHAEEITVRQFYEKLGDAKAFIKPGPDFEAAAETKIKVEAGNYPSSLNHWFVTDFAALRHAFHASDDLEAKEKWIDTFSFNPEKSTFSYTHPTLSYWDTIPHPPIFELTRDLSTYSKFYGSPRTINDALLEPAYQAELDRLTGSELSVGNQLEYLSDKDILQEAIRQIDRAKKSILLSNMLMSCDEDVEPLHEALKRAITERGVQVYAVFELVFATEYEGCYRKLQKAGAHVLLAKKMLRLKNRYAYHQKYFVFDDEVGMVIGANLIDTEISGTGFNGLLHDSGVLIHGPLVHDLTVGFSHTVHDLQLMPFARFSRAASEFAQAAREKIEQERKDSKRGAPALEGSRPGARPQGMCRVVFQGAKKSDREPINRLYSSLFDHAQKSVYAAIVRLPIDSGDESPKSRALVQKLIDKTKTDENFRVDILTNNYLSASDIKSKSYDSKSILTQIYSHFVGNENLHQSVSQLRSDLRPIVGPGFELWDYFQYTHQKVAVIDRTLDVLGSYNVNKLSAEGSYEMSVVCYDDHLNEQIERGLIRDLMNSLPILRGK